MMALAFLRRSGLIQFNDIFKTNVDKIGYLIIIDKEIKWILFKKNIVQMNYCSSNRISLPL